MGKVDKYLNWVRIKVNICKKIIQWLPQSGFRGCALCRALTSEMVCQDCYTFLPHFKPGCNRCGYPILSLNSNYYCDECEQIEPAFDSILALFHYIWPVHFWIRKLKFEHKLEIAHFFGQKMAESFSLLIKPDVIVPVPLHIQRHRQRGFNQSIEIAQPISQYYEIPLCSKSLQRIKCTRTQRELNYEERKRNVESAFIARSEVKGRAILLIDDVITTGATAHAASLALKQAGATHVQVWSVCRSC